MAKKILLADDSITIQKVVELTFSDGDYEVTAVNNGAKAIQKLSEMRPDIILSDIIMPEKNGYEVCEFVKSHPEYRNIPVILLTGTFEPFDPDRADKAGCDAVVTKPFESQSLIHKVEELIQQSQNAPPPEPEPLFADAPSFNAPSFDAPSFDATAVTPRPPSEPFTHDNDIFAAPPAATPTLATEMPFDSPSEPAFGGETRAFPRMSFEEMQQMAHEPAHESASEPTREPISEPTTAPQPAMPEPEASPWDEAPQAFGGETRAFPRMSFEEMQQMASEARTPAHTASPFDEPTPTPMAPEPSPWDEPQEDAAATRAVPNMSFDEMRRMAETAEPQAAPFETPSAPPAPEHSPWDEQPSSFGGETRAFPRMSFEDLEKMAPSPARQPEPAWAPSEEMNTADPFAEPPHDESPFAAQEMPEPAAAEPEWSIPAPSFEDAVGMPVNSQITDAAAHDEPPAEHQAATVATPGETAGEPAHELHDLTDEQVDRIARRVVQLMSEQVVRNIAWEVIPDLAEMVVKERIRQLEAEA